MEINLRGNFGGNMGLVPDMRDASVGSAERSEIEPSDTARGLSDVSIGNRLDALSDSEPTADIPDAVLDRDDELGRLINAAFDLPSPPMPSFD